MNPLQLIEASVMHDHKLRLTFNDGRSGILDFTKLIEDDLPPIFATLKDAAVLNAFDIREGTLHWWPDLDLAPEYLYFRTFESEPALLERFIAWGYATLASIALGID